MTNIEAEKEATNELKEFAHLSLTADNKDKTTIEPSKSLCYPNLLKPALISLEFQSEFLLTSAFDDFR